MHKKHTELTTKTLTLATARYGTLAPQIELTTPKGTHYRALSAAAHRLAADIETQTPRSERWNVNIELSSDNRAYVSLELMTGSAEEAERGMALLRTLVA